MRWFVGFAGAPWRRTVPVVIMAGLVCGVAPGCNREEVRVYRVEKSRSEASASSPHGSAMTGGGLGGMTGHPHGDLMGPKPQIEYSRPAGWTEQTPTLMRAASFLVGDSQGPQADVGVIPLRGLTGRATEMWNLWRQQLGLPEGDTEAMNRSAVAVTIDGHQGRLFDLATAEPPPGQSQRIRILGAMVDVGDVAWFFKMTGPDKLVEEQKETFVNWLRSVRFLPDEPSVAASGTGAESEPPLPQWEVPSGWQSAPAGQFLVAKFLVGTGDRTAEVNISRSAGDGGGWVNNVNRWRRQLGLSEVGSEEIRKDTVAVPLSQGQAMQIELAGTDAKTGQPTRVIGVMVPLAGWVWFYKLSGPPELVEVEKAAFIRFVSSARY